MSREAQSALKLFRIMYVVYVMYEKSDFREFPRGFRSGLFPMISSGTCPSNRGGGEYESSELPKED